MKNITQESVCNSEMKTADFSLFMQSEMKNCGILTNITEKYVCNSEMETADFYPIYAIRNENLDKLNAE
ncbi:MULTISPECIES: hypothetical protein [Tenacibaculum]|uniref:hypothetical protein n=2 Tax=Flavobacteriaceae TaxID=49546 RepID=UPI001EFDAB0F|nr:MULTISPECIES: hypothetical protein [Tenacibaculum]MCD8423602.1 hypothetical protein [Tenacibaculum finnmarkense genomovar ulcerans]